MSDEKYTPLIDRERDSKQRVHQELTEAARERLVVITESASKHSPTALGYLIKKVGTTPFEKYIDQGTVSNIQAVNHQELILKAETLHVFQYIEILINRHHELLVEHRKDKRKNWQQLDKSIEAYEPSDAIRKIITHIEDVLITEGILWDLRRVGEGGVIEFSILESKGLKQIDEDLREASANQPWSDALKGYNAAFDRYLQGDFDDTLVTKLYNSIEELLQTICVDLEGWTDDSDRSHSYYLDMLNEHGVYNANGITAPELNQLLDALEKMVSKVGNDRKQRHAYHDRAYCTLLIHQTGAYLYFLISRYEDYSS